MFIKLSFVSLSMSDILKINIVTDRVQNHTCVGSDASPKARFERG